MDCCRTNDLWLLRMACLLPSLPSPHLTETGFSSPEIAIASALATSSSHHVNLRLDPNFWARDCQQHSTEIVGSDAAAISRLRTEQKAGPRQVRSWKEGEMLAAAVARICLFSTSPQIGVTSEFNQWV